MTATNVRVSQASHMPDRWMEWYRVEVSAVESDKGYRILASRIGGVWCYSAYGPKEKIVQENGRKYFRGFEYKMRYAVGECIPPSFSLRSMTTRWPIGCYREDQYGGTDAALSAAKAACVLDYENNYNGVGDAED